LQKENEVTLNEAKDKAAEESKRLGLAMVVIQDATGNYGIDHWFDREKLANAGFTIITTFVGGTEQEQT
jgi:hypothetical protein